MVAISFVIMNKINDSDNGSTMILKLEINENVREIDSVSVDNLKLIS